MRFGSEYFRSVFVLIAEAPPLCTGRTGGTRERRAGGHAAVWTGDVVTRGNLDRLGLSEQAGRPQTDEVAALRGRVVLS